MDIKTKAAHGLVKIHNTAEPIRFDHTGFGLGRLLAEIMNTLAQPQYKNRGGEIVIRLSTDGPISEAANELSEHDKMIQQMLSDSAASGFVAPDWQIELAELIILDKRIQPYKSLFTERGRVGKSPEEMTGLRQHVESIYTPQQIWGDDCTEWPSWN